MSKCPHCGKDTFKLGGKYIEQVEKLLGSLDIDFGELTFTAKEARLVAREKGIAKDRFEAVQIWDRLRWSGLIEGHDPQPRYNSWTIKKEETDAND